LARLPVIAWVGLEQAAILRLSGRIDA